MPQKGHIYNKVYGRDAYRLQTYTKNPIRPVPITSHTPTLIFFKKRHFDRNYSVHHLGLTLSKTRNNDTCYIEANTIGSTRCKRYYYPIDIKLLYLRPQIPDLRPQSLVLRPPLALLLQTKSNFQYINYPYFIWMLSGKKLYLQHNNNILTLQT